VNVFLFGYKSKLLPVALYSLVNRFHKCIYIYFRKKAYLICNDIYFVSLLTLVLLNVVLLAVFKLL